MNAATVLGFFSRSIHVDGRDHPSTDDELLLRIVAILSIECDGEAIYSEPEFPVVELASALNAWLSIPERTRPDFSFESMEAAERGLVWIRSGADGWRVGSARQLRGMTKAVSLGEVDFAIRRYLRDVASQAKGLGCDVTRVIERQRD